MWRVVIAGLCFLPLACATVASGTKETISVTSSPAGANARLACEKSSGEGVTPWKLTIRRNAGDCVLTVSKEGFEDRVVTIEQGVNPMYWENMLFAPVAPAGGYFVLVGDTQEKAVGVGLLVAAGVIFGTDFGTGAVHVHRPAVVDVVLKPASP